MSETRTIEVGYLARVEGEGSLHLTTKDDSVETARLAIFEPPRFFEAFLRDRDFREAPDITARICGICPVAYQMGACNAMESIVGARVEGTLRELRRFLYCGEWIESHGLHLFMLHLPDFLGYPDAVTLAKDHPDLVKKGLRIKKIGNRIMTVLGGREIHPVNVKVGGFYRAPTVAELEELRPELEWGLGAMEEVLEYLATLHFPEFERDYEFLALSHPDEYAITEGRLVSSSGIDVPVEEYDTILDEEHVFHSTALQSRMTTGNRPAHLGPLARFALNRDKLTPRAAAAAERSGLGTVCRNPFQSLLVRGVEIVFAFEESLRLLDRYRKPEAHEVPVAPKAGTGHGATEAPRGICYHRYTTDAAGLITDAKIVAPTSVNQRVIEDDLRSFAEPNLHLDDDELRHRLEQAIRNYDPCISCSTHFLDLTVERG